MKTIIIPKKFFLVLSAGILLLSCKKDVAKEQSAVVSGESNASVIRERDASGTVVILRPGEDGQDTYVSKIDASSTDGNTNLNYTNEILASKFYYNGQLATQRGYIKFDSLLYVIPAGAKIIYARLDLFGKSNPFSFPSGNSYYPGSPNPENTCLLQLVTGGDWNESTITWNNMPATTSAREATIDASTSRYHYNTSVDVTALVEQILKHGTNYGFCMRMVTEESYRIMNFSSSEVPEVYKRPKLVIKYR